MYIGPKYACYWYCRGQATVLWRSLETPELTILGAGVEILAANFVRPPPRFITTPNSWYWGVFRVIVPFLCKTYQVSAYFELILEPNSRCEGSHRGSGVLQVRTKVLYKVHITTGDRRFAGTGAGISLIMRGAKPPAGYWAAHMSRATALRTREKENCKTNIYILRIHI